MPLKRHPALQDLSRDHQLFLIEARTMRWLADDDPRAPELKTFLETFRVFWEYHGNPHIEEEELVLYPFCFEDQNDLDVIQLRIDHRWLRDRVEAIQQNPQNVTLAALRELAEHITKHVRFEERVIFERIQENLSEEQLSELATRSLSFRQDNRPEDAIGPNRSVFDEI